MSVPTVKVFLYIKLFYSFNIKIKDKYIYHACLVSTPQIRLYDLYSTYEIVFVFQLPLMGG